MKKQRKLPDQLPSRKSPRLASASSSSSSPSTRHCNEAKPGPEARPDNALALSLHVAAEQQPLSIYYPCHVEEDNSVRRSPRFTSNKYKTPPPEPSRSQKHTALVLSKLSMSPAVPFSSSARALTLPEGKNVGPGEAGPKKRRRLSEGRAADSLSLVENGNSRGSKSGSRGCLSERCLRSRTVLMKVADGGDFSVKERRLRSRVVRYGVAEPPEASEKRVARSGSGALIEVCRDEGESPRMEMLALPPAPISIKNCSRPRAAKMQLQEERLERSACVKNASLRSASRVKLNRDCLVTPKKESSLGEEKCNIEGVIEKRLRYRVVSYGVAESPEASEMRVVRSGSGEKRLRSSVSERREKGKAAAEKIELFVNEDESPQIKMLTLPQATPVSTKNCLRPRTTSVKNASLPSASGVKLNKECSVTPETESSLGESSAKEQCDLEGMSEKQLRSRKIQLKLNVAESAVRKPGTNGGGRDGESAVKSEKKEKSIVCCFVGEPIPEVEARERWQWRYDLKSRKKGKNWKINPDAEDEIILNVESHYAQAKVGNFVLNIGDCVFVKGEGSKKHIGRILEFFKTTEGEDYFRVQWFFRAEDTVLKDAASSHDKRRIFYSTLMNDNVLDCIISKVKIVKVPPMLCLKRNPVQSAAFYYDMEYSVQYSTFRTLVTETSTESEPFLSNSKLPGDVPITLTPLMLLPDCESPKQELALLDLYSGCGGMSTGLCLGAKLSGVDLMTKWAVDYNSSACESLKLNHLETNVVRNESAEDFLDLLKQWECLCKTYVSDIERTLKCELDELPEAEACMSPSDTEESTGEYEVSCLIDICYGDPNKSGKRSLHFKVRWKGYGPDDDTWEAAEGLSNCQERIEDFVRRGFNAKILPLPGDVDVICGGPPCQGISGFNRYRNFASPLEDERNRQIVVFMDIVEFLKPKYCLMENVVDIIRFDKGSLGRYALSRLVLMKYQARLGTVASGCYGLPQFRLRVFIWGAHPTQTLPQFPLPTHNVVARYWPPIEFERNIVAYDEGQPRALQDAIVLGDSISDLPPVTNDEEREEMAYEKPPETEFQRRIRLSKDEMMGRASAGSHAVLYDHRPLKLSEHDYMRVSRIPHRKGANFRDLDGVVIGEDNVARRDPTREAVMLPTGRPLIPDCVFKVELGKSRRPYGRLWWDETVSTVVTFPHIRVQAILHPDQDRRLTIRECARLQGFPDYYRFCGTIKDRYSQVGNAVSIPVSRALGYALGVAYRKAAGDEPLMTLPPGFTSMLPSST